MKVGDLTRWVYTRWRSNVSIGETAGIILRTFPQHGNVEILDAQTGAPTEIQCHYLEVISESR
jgi:hypothetical protein